MDNNKERTTLKKRTNFKLGIENKINFSYEDRLLFFTKGEKIFLRGIIDGTDITGSYRIFSVDSSLCLRNDLNEADKMYDEDYLIKNYTLIKDKD